MGQYFRLVNLDRREYVDAHKIGCGAKLWEWCVNTQAGILLFLVRRSSDYGGGDIEKSYLYAGRWAGDSIVLVGDYDDSGLYDEVVDSGEYVDISYGVAKEFSDFVGRSFFKFVGDSDGIRFVDCSEE